MFATNEIHSLTDFQRNTKEYVQRLSDTKKPEVLTVNGKAQLVIQDANSYQELLDLVATIKKVNAAADAFDRGQGRPVAEAFAELNERLKAKYGTNDI